MQAIAAAFSSDQHVAGSSICGSNKMVKVPNSTVIAHPMSYSWPSIVSVELYIGQLKSNRSSRGSTQGCSAVECFRRKEQAVSMPGN